MTQAGPTPEVELEPATSTSPMKSSAELVWGSTRDRLLRLRTAAIWNVLERAPELGLNLDSFAS